MSALGPDRSSGLVCAGILVAVLVAACSASEDDRDVGEVKVLRRQVQSLSEALVSAKMECDGLKARLETRAHEADETSSERLGGSAILRDKKYLILDVNKELGMVILNGGRRDGVKPGLMFDVISGDKSVATVRVVDSRSAIAGAVIQNVGRELPKVQDRVVLAAGSKN
ncbi:MAG: hypothetical protein WCS52_06485 [bacterium]